MSDSVKFIFKTLIKVPCYIMVAYMLLNLFAFSFTYFRVLGFSYVVMQTAVENNYIPTSEKNQLNKYLDEITQSAFVSNAYIVYNSNSRTDGIIEEGVDTTIPSAEERRQYGRPVRVGVAFNYTFIWPLMPNQQVQDGKNAVAGLGGTDSASLSQAQLDQAREDVKSTNSIEIVYTVPGLKYYPDLISY